jgi:hypothetical protein
MLPQVLEIIFEMQRKMIMKNNKKKNKLSNLQNMFSFSLGPSYFKPHNFLISYSF